MSVGIPAYNEEGNIKQLLESIQKQTQTLFILEKIIVIMDSCTDRTAEIVAQVALHDKRIVYVERKIREGKSSALNVIYEMNTSDLLFVPDADIILSDEQILNEMVKVFKLYPKTHLVSARHIPAHPTTLMGEFARYSYLSLEDSFMQLNDGNNFYSVMSASMITKKFADSFRYPKHTLSDQNYLYAKATRNNNEGYKFASKAKVIFKTVDSFSDWRLLATRSVIGDKADIAKHFGKGILQEYTIPKYLVIKTLLIWLIKHPFFIAGSIFMNIFIRLFPLHQEPLNGMWEATKSSKFEIHL